MEDRALYEIVAPEVEEKENFVIDNDSKAEWALNVIKIEREDRDRLISICEQKIQEYQQKIEEFKKQYENRTSYFISLLNQYFQTVPHKSTKTQETYQLPSGKLKLKLPSLEFKRDDSKLLEWLETSGLDKYIQIKKSPKWAELKKTIQVCGDKAVMPEGEIIDGVTVVEKPAIFEVDV